MRGAGGDSPGGEYERYRGAVLGMLAKRFPRLDDDERLAIYHDAWTRVYVKRERGEPIGALRAYLMATAGAEALHLVSRGRAPTPIGPDDPRLEALADDAPPPDEQVVTRDQARIARSLIDALDERQRDVLKLRWDLQLTAAEVRAALRLSERQYRRLAEEGAAALASRVEELQSGQWSRRTRSLLVACLVEVTREGERQVGIASRRQREEAQRLLESDPHVAALYAEVRRSIRGAAALLPLPIFVADHGGLAVALGDVASGARAHVASAVDAAKQQAMSLYVRISDPALLTSPRPGSAAIALAAVVTVGGGAYGTYDAVSRPSESSPPAAAAKPVIPAPRAKTAPYASSPRVRRAPRPATSPVELPAPPQPITPPQPTEPPPPQPTPTPSQPTPAQPTEFGFED